MLSVMYCFSLASHDSCRELWLQLLGVSPHPLFPRNLAYVCKGARKAQVTVLIYENLSDSIL